MSRFRLKTLFLIVLVAAIGSLALSRYLLMRPPAQGVYSSAALKKFLRDGKPVLVTVDADWAMKPAGRPRFMSPDVSRRIRELKIETLTANWTLHDPAVDALMRSLKEDRVPTLALFTPQAPNQPFVLPHHPSTTDILDAIEGAVTSDTAEP